MRAPIAIALVLAVVLAALSVSAAPSDNVEVLGAQSQVIERTFERPLSQVWFHVEGSDVIVYLNFESADPDTKKVYDGEYMVTPKGTYNSYRIVVGAVATDVFAWNWR